LDRIMDRICGPYITAFGVNADGNFTLFHPRKCLNKLTFIIVFLAIVGVVCWLIYVYQCFKSRLRKKLDVAMAHTLLSISLLIIAIIVLPFIIFYQLKVDVLSIRLTVVYGSLLILGWISSLILGQTFKTLPFIVWTKRYQHIAGSKITLLPAQLYNSFLLNIQFISFLMFIISFSLGLFLKLQLLVYIGVVCLGITALLYVSNVLITLLKNTET
ncbi:MAG: hypothetical protein KJ712_08575, partial [Bacteroidetes bacterium]|nr:hypothetical protein [Bacteroidota bacterium]